MRLVDVFIDTIMFVRSTQRNIEEGEEEYEVVRGMLTALLEQSGDKAKTYDFSNAAYAEARFAVVAYIDELILCSDWSEKSRWKKEPMQRFFYDTSNAGSEFYERLNRLNKHGVDKEVREVYLLCMGLGFKGKYFDLDDRKKHEEVKGFNLSLLLPKEAAHNIDKTALFSSAYSERQLRDIELKSRLNLMPFIVGVPVIIVMVFFVGYSQRLSDLLNQLASVVS